MERLYPGEFSNNLKKTESTIALESWYHYCSVLRLQPDGVPKAYQAKKDSGNENESDQEVKANQPVKVVRKPREEDLCLEPLCDEVVEKMKKEGIDMSQVRIGAFQRMICPKVCLFW